MTADDELFDSEVQTTEGISPEAPVKDRPRDEQGRFAPKDTGEATETVEGAPPAPAERQPHMVPLTTVLDEREKRQRIEAERDQYRRMLAEMEQRNQPAEIPDPITDAEGYTQHLEQRFRAQLDNREAMLSEHYARDKFGNEAVDAAFQAAQSNGALGHFMSGVDRWQRLVQWHHQQREYAERSSPDYEAKLREKLRAELMAELGQPQSSARVPRSLASAGGSVHAPPPKGSDPLFD